MEFLVYKFCLILLFCSFILGFYWAIYHRYWGTIIVSFPFVLFTALLVAGFIFPNRYVGFAAMGAVLISSPFIYKAVRKKP